LRFFAANTASHIRSDPKLDRNTQLGIPLEPTSSLAKQSVNGGSAVSDKSFGVTIASGLNQRERSDFASAVSHLTPKGSFFEQTSGSAVQTEQASSVGSRATSKPADIATTPIIATTLAALTSSPGRMIRKLDNLRAEK